MNNFLLGNFAGYNSPNRRVQLLRRLKLLHSIGLHFSLSPVWWSISNNIARFQMLAPSLKLNTEEFCAVFISIVLPNVGVLQQKTPKRVGRMNK